MKHERKITMNVGIISFLTIFVILCLVTFSVLSLSSAKSNQNMTEKSITHKTEYYELCNQGEAYLEKIDNQLYENYQNSSSQIQYFSLLENIKTIDSNIEINNQSLSFDIIINKQKLHVELNILYPGNQFYELKTWNIESSEKWQADQGLNIL